MYISKKYNKLWKYIHSLFFLSILGYNSSSAQHYEVTPRLEIAYEHILKLELEEGQRIIDAEKLNNPSNYLTYHFENYIDFFKCFVSEEEELFDELKDNKDSRLYYLENGDENSPYHLFSQAEVILQWALARLKFEEYFTAAIEINKAIKLLERNDDLFPEFVLNKKSLSALHALVGTIPSKYKYVLQYISSFSGTIQEGYSEINYVVNYIPKDHLFYREALAIKSLIELHLLNKKEDAYQTITSYDLDLVNNPLACFLQANISHKVGKNDEAIEILTRYNNNSSRYPMHHLKYQLGIYKLNRLDSGSDQYIRDYISNFGGRNYIKEAYQKLAWYEWVINQDAQEYNKNLQFCKSEGYKILDEDIQALSIAQWKHLPPTYILKARLLTDGGYYEKAKLVLSTHANDSRSEWDDIEYDYRLARTYHSTKEYALAKSYYNRALERRKFEKTYFQTASALNLGLLFEQESNYQLAKKYFNLCLGLNPKQYKSSLHQKAKAGLQRILMELP